MLDGIVVLGAEVPSGRAVAMKLRTEHYSCRLLASGARLDEITAQEPSGIILAGEVTEGAAQPNPDVLSLGVPVLALGSSARALCARVGERCEGDVIINAVTQVTYKKSPLFAEVGSSERWVERAEPYAMPETYRSIAEGERFPLGFCDDAARVFMLQFQIERNDPDGMAMLLGFASFCGCTPWWTVDSMIQMAEATIRDATGERNAICAMSGGLDSTVAAVLAGRMLGDRLLCVFVDTGLMRQGESEEVERYFRRDLSMRFMRIDVSEAVLSELAGVTSARDKSAVVEREISRALRKQADEIGGAAVLIRGTNFVEVIGDSGPDEFSWPGPVVEPLLPLLKDEIRVIGEHLGLLPSVISRQSFPGMGLAARIHGEVTPARLATLRRADAIFTAELDAAGLSKRLKRYFAMLDSVNGQESILLRATQGAEPTMSAARLPYDLLERTIDTIRKELPQVRRILYDMTPGRAEWV